MNKENILLIVGSPAGGIGTHIVAILKGLNNEFNFYLATSLDKQDESFHRNLDLDELNIKDIKNVIIEKKPSCKDFQNLYILWKYYREKNIDLVHGHGAKGGLYARLLGKLLGIKVIYTPHGGSMHQMHGKIMNKVYMYVEKFLYYLTDIIIFESEYSKNIYTDKIHKNNPEKMIVNYNGIEVKECVPKREYQVPIKLASFGLLRHLKGHDLAIKAVDLLIKKGYEVVYTIYGKGEEKKKLQYLIKSLSLHDYVKLYGFVDNIEPYVKEADIILHPSRFEALPYVPIEAMNLCRTVIVSDVGGLTEIVKHNENGLVFKKESVEDLASKIEYLILNKEAYSLYSKNAKQTIESKFNIEKMLKTLTEVYEQS